MVKGVEDYTRIDYYVFTGEEGVPHLDEMLKDLGFPSHEAFKEEPEKINSEGLLVRVTREDCKCSMTGRKVFGYDLKVFKRKME